MSPDPNPTEEAFIHYNNSVPGLVVLCQGLKTASGGLFIDVDSDPWKSMPRDHSKPKAKMFRQEVMRRHRVLDINSPKPRSNHWTVEKCQQFLDDNPITNADEISFLKSKIEEHKVIQEAAKAARSMEVDASEKNWVGKVPYLRLIHCLVDHDDIKMAYLRRHDIDNTRISLDNRNSDVRQPTVYELIADRWNDPTFAPETEVFPDLHPDFIFSQFLSFDLFCELAAASPQRVKDKLQSLNVTLSRVVSNWERSGQGDGGILDDDDDDENTGYEPNSRHNHRDN
jgi:hypothetical protein